MISDIQASINKFNGKYELIDYGYSSEGYNGGFILMLKMNFIPRRTSNEASLGKMRLVIDTESGIMVVGPGFLKDIEFLLSTIA